MVKNVGTIDRVIRALIGVAVVAAWYTGALTGTALIVAGVVAVIMIGTSAVSFCPLYRVLGMSTCRVA